MGLIGALALLILACRPSGEQARIYYVDQTSSGAGTGRSTMKYGPTAAFNSIDDIPTLEAGDTVLFRRGHVFRLPDTNWVITSDGTADEPIVIGSYSTGPSDAIITGSISSAESGATWTASSGGTNEFYLSVSGSDPGFPKPYRLFWSDFTEIAAPSRTSGGRNDGSPGSLTDSTWAYGDNDGLGFSTIYVRVDSGTPDAVEIPTNQTDAPMIYASGADYIHFHDLIVQCGDGADSTHSADGIGGTQAAGLQIRDCELRFMRGSGITLFDVPGVEISDCEIHENWSNGIGINGSFLQTTTGILIDSNHIWGQVEWGSNGGAGIWSFAISGTLSNNLIHNNSEGGARLDGGLEAVGGFPAWNKITEPTGGYGLDDSFVLNNHVYSNGNVGGGVPGWGTGGGGIYLECAQHNFIAYNECHDNTLLQCAVQLDRSVGNVFAYNLCYDSSNPIGDKLMAADWGPDSTSFFNNVMDHGGYGIIMRNGIGTTLKNNIMVDIGLRDYLFNDSSYVNVTDSNHNMMHREGAWSVQIQDGGDAGNYTLATWNTLSAFDADSFSDDPTFVDETNHDYHLDVGSPCIDTGTDVGLTLDFEGNTVPVDSVDVGAYEVQP